MRITHETNPISFGCTTELSKLWWKGLLPTVEKGFYGDVLEKGQKSLQRVSNEHLLPKSQGGSKKLTNIVLASTQNNNNRGSRPLSEVFNTEAAEEYYSQFKDVVVHYGKGKKHKVFNGNDYIEGIKHTVRKLLGMEGRLDLLKPSASKLDVIG